MTLVVIPAAADLRIEDIGKSYTMDPARTPPGLHHHIERDIDVIGGNTSVRNVPAENLVWKGGPNSNGYGYFQRNRDLGQVFVVDGGQDVRIDAIILRSARGDNAIMRGTPGAAMYVQFFEVTEKPGETFRINENGTTKGDRATHGFDHQFNRADDFFEGEAYRPVAQARGGVFPEVPPTTQYAYLHRGRRPFGEQQGHLRFFRFDLTGEDEIVLEAGKRYAFLLGFEEPGNDQGLGLAIDSEVHTKEPAEFVRDLNGEIRWGIRREGSGILPPTMIEQPEPPADEAQRNMLIGESMFASRHWDTLSPTSNGYPDVDTYRTLQFYIETLPVKNDK